MPMKKVLIFGIDSFTGKHLRIYLENDGFEVYGTTYKLVAGDKNYQCDISKKEQVRKVLSVLNPDFIINLAAISFVGYQDKEPFYSVNVLAVENILESVLEVCMKTPEKVILCSSATIYGNQKKNVLDEFMCPNPVNHYGISKLAMEQIAKIYFDKLNIIITRPFNYTGVGQAENFLIPKIVSHYKKKAKEIELGNINVFREFNDIEYVCESYKRLLVCTENSEIVNIASNRTIALIDVIRSMNEIAGYNIEININPKFVRKNEIVSLSGSTKKLYDLVGEIEQKEFKKTLEKMYYD